jgi:hypothetical protein
VIYAISTSWRPRVHYALVHRHFRFGRSRNFNDPFDYLCSAITRRGGQSVTREARWGAVWHDRVMLIVAVTGPQKLIGDQAIADSHLPEEIDRSSGVSLKLAPQIRNIGSNIVTLVGLARSPHMTQ